jgi:hypothetical protein
MLTIFSPSLNLIPACNQTHKGRYAVGIKLAQLGLRVPRINFLLT